jgi:hypothetical protein
MEKIIQAGISCNPDFINILSQIQNTNLCEKEKQLDENNFLQENLRNSTNFNNDENLKLEYYDSDTEEINFPLSVKMTDHNPCREDEINLKNSKNLNFMKMSNEESLFNLHDDEILSVTDHVIDTGRHLAEKNSYRMESDENLYPEQLFTFDNNYREKMHLQSQNKKSDTPSRITNSQRKFSPSPKISNRTIETDLINLLKSVSDFKSQMISNMELITNFYENLETEIMATERGEKNISHFDKNQDIIEKCLNSINLIKINFLKTFDETENNFVPYEKVSNKKNNSFCNSDTLKLDQSHDKNLSYKNRTPNQMPQIQMDTSLQELVKINSTHVNKSCDIHTSKNLTINRSLNLTNQSLNNFSQLKADQSNFYLLKNSEANNNLSCMSINNLEQGIRQSNESNINLENFKQEFVKKIKSHYREKVLKINESKNAEINKLNNQIKNYEEMINSSKNLIDEIYRKNKLLKDKLVKYKLLVDKQVQEGLVEKLKNK